ncbi:MAG: LysE family transporter [Aliifodinibius sp.]|nr:LysE family translocator [candidate division Zixibacteria bacterium]NIT60611.1 LysE family translocator [Fodinibius sp.]NIS48282.1 LysE family translocator [candidate division Zixibacteria bacterium]NIU16400.1 LysE family translocator [candidate division Zixibacteria bacterium]NIV08521.1 LysE family transporter [candidate division Zixibacteria bacterium]
MFDISTLAIYMTAVTILLITPGPAVLYVVARSIDQGARAGIISTMGISVGTLVHVAGAALGISAILVTSAVAFNVVKYLGAAYLIYLGIRKFLENESFQSNQQQNGNSSQSFYRGIIVSLFNPKSALFFLAFLPQFVDVSNGSPAIQMLVLGAIFVVMGIVNDSLYALLAGKIGGWLKSNLSFIRAQKYFSGSVYIALGIATALSGSEKK